MGEWTAWEGCSPGGLPPGVKHGDIVSIRLRHGGEMYDAQAEYCWFDHRGIDQDIVAYKTDPHAAACAVDDYLIRALLELKA